MNEPASSWRVILLHEPAKVLRRLPRDLLRRFRHAIRELAVNPRPSGCVKLAGYENLYRVRVGDWRIIYALEEERLVVVVIEIAPRGEAYRGL